jgi:hypothetical protein
LPVSIFPYFPRERLSKLDTFSPFVSSEKGRDSNLEPEADAEDVS